MERRKDNKGRVLKEGESQRKDGLYQYRWTDKFGKRHTIYASDLKALRDKIESITELEKKGINPVAASTTVMELVKRYLDIHKFSLRTTTLNRINTFLNILEDEPFSVKPISTISVSDAKLFIKELYEDGYAYGTIANYKSILKPAFELACEDNILPSNPFSFSLAKVVPKDQKEKNILSKEQYLKFIKFCKRDKFLMHHVDEIIILYETGLRVSEFCGLTFDDVDFENNTIKVDHQLMYVKGKNVILKPKTKSSIRTIPMSLKAKEAFAHLIDIRIPIDDEPVVDGYSGFFQISYNGNPRNGYNVGANIKTAFEKYNKEHPDDPIPFSISPHTFRHTFCTRMIESGMNIKAVQYIMGHSRAEVTLNIYSHIDSERAIQEFWKMTK